MIFVECAHPSKRDLLWVRAKNLSLPSVLLHLLCHYGYNTFRSLINLRESGSGIWLHVAGTKSVCEHEVEKQEQYHSSLARVELLSRTEVG